MIEEKFEKYTTILAELIGPSNNLISKMVACVDHKPFFSIVIAPLLSNIDSSALSRLILDVQFLDYRNIVRLNRCLLLNE